MIQIHRTEERKERESKTMTDGGPSNKGVVNDSIDKNLVDSIFRTATTSYTERLVPIYQLGITYCTS